MTLENKIKEVEKEEKTLKAKVEKSKALRQKSQKKRLLQKTTKLVWEMIIKEKNWNWRKKPENRVLTP